MINFPNSIDDDTTLFETVNNLRARLTIGIDEFDTTIQVTSTSGFPSAGYITILSSSDITKAEAIRYDTISATQFIGVTRGAGGTTAVAHIVNDDVDHTIVADHHNEIKNATIALENFVGTNPAANFVYRNSATGDAIVDNNLTVSGLSALDDDVDIKQQLTVSGIAQFGPIPQSTTAAGSIVTNDVVGTVTSTSFITVLQSSPLNSAQHLVFWRGNVGWSSAGNNPGSADEVQIRVQFNAIDIAECSNDAEHDSPNTQIKGGHTFGTDISGFRVVTGDASAVVRIQARRTSGGAAVEHGSLAIVSLPLDAMQLVEDTDYFFKNGVDAASFNNNPAGFKDEDSFTFSVPDPGEYLIMVAWETRTSGYAEQRIELDSPGTYLTDSLIGIGDNASDWGPNNVVVIKTLSAGSHTMILQDRPPAAFTSAETRRVHWFVVRNATFDQLNGIQSSIDQSTSSTTNIELTAFTQTHLPITREQLFVLGTGMFKAANNAAAVAYTIRNTTDEENYRTDSGTWIGNDGAPGAPDTDSKSVFLFHLLDVSIPTEFELQFRVSNTTSLVTNTEGSLILWGLSKPPLSQDIAITTIDVAEVTTHKIDSDIINITQSSTVSGAAVMIGMPIDATFGNLNVTNITATGLGDFTTVGVDTLTAVTGSFSESLTVSGFPVTINASVFNPSQNETITGEWDFTNSLQVSGVPVTTAATTLQEAYDTDDGIITTTVGKDFTLDGTGAITAVTGTFTDGITVGVASTAIDTISITTGSGIFTDTLTVSGIPVNLTGGGSSLTVRETDSNPTVSNVTTIVVTANTLTDDGGGQVTIDTGGGSSSLTVEEIDGNPSVSNVDTIRFTNSTVTDDTGGQVTIDVGSGSGITSINAQTGPAVTITGVGGIQTTTDSDVITIDFPSSSVAGFSGATVKLDVFQDIVDSTNTPVSWDSVLSDEGGWADLDADSEILTVPEGQGITHVRVMAQVAWEASSNNTRRILVLDHNGGSINSTFVRTATVSSSATLVAMQQAASPTFSVSPGDTLSVRVFQTSGGNLQIDPSSGSSSTWFSVERVNPIAASGTEFVSISGSFTESLTVSGISVNIGGGGVTVRTPDSDPSVSNVNEIVVASGSLTDNGGGQVTIGPLPLILSVLAIGSSNFSVPTGSNQLVNWDRTMVDTDGKVDDGPSGLIRPDGDGFEIPAHLHNHWFIARAQINWANATDNKQRLATIFGPLGTGRPRASFINPGPVTDTPGGDVSDPDPDSNSLIQQVMSMPFMAGAGTSVTLGLTHNTGSPIDILGVDHPAPVTWFSLERVAISGTL